MLSKRFLLSVATMCSILLLSTVPAFGAHPLLSDDTFTQGKGKVQIETSYKYDRDDDNGVRTQTSQPQIQLTYGILDTLDAVVTVPYLFVRTEQGGDTTSADGFGDISAALKWRFYGEKEKGLQFAIKPSLTFPTGDEQKGLGMGQSSSGASYFYKFDRQSYGVTFIGTYEKKDRCVSANAGYQHNRYGFQSDEDAFRHDIWSASLSGQYEMIENVWLVGEVGVASNPNAVSDTLPAYVLGGVIYEIAENVDLDLGYKYGLTKPAVDYSISGAVTIRF
jgi:hypothetical protein